MKRILAIEPPRGDNGEDSTTKTPSTGYQPKATEPDAVPSSTGTLVLSPAFEKRISEIFGSPSAYNEMITPMLTDKKRPAEAVPVAGLQSDASPQGGSFKRSCPNVSRMARETNVERAIQGLPALPSNQVVQSGRATGQTGLPGSNISTTSSKKSETLRLRIAQQTSLREIDELKVRSLALQVKATRDAAALESELIQSEVAVAERASREAEMAVELIECGDSDDPAQNLDNCFDEIGNPTVIDDDYLINQFNQENNHSGQDIRPKNCGNQSNKVGYKILD